MHSWQWLQHHVMTICISGLYGDYIGQTCRDNLDLRFTVFVHQNTVLKEGYLSRDIY